MSQPYQEGERKPILGVPIFNPETDQLSFESSQTEPVVLRTPEKHIGKDSTFVELRPFEFYLAENDPNALVFSPKTMVFSYNAIGVLLVLPSRTLLETEPGLQLFEVTVGVRLPREQQLEEQFCELWFTKNSGDRIPETTIFSYLKPTIHTFDNTTYMGNRWIAHASPSNTDLPLIIPHLPELYLARLRINLDRSLPIGDRTN